MTNYHSLKSPESPQEPVIPPSLPEWLLPPTNALPIEDRFELKVWLNRNPGVPDLDMHDNHDGDEKRSLRVPEKYDEGLVTPPTSKKDYLKINPDFEKKRNECLDDPFRLDDTKRMPYPEYEPLFTGIDFIHDEPRQYNHFSNTAGEAALMMEVAGGLGIKADKYTAPDAAATAHKEYADYLNARNPHLPLFEHPDGVAYADTARKIVDAGGALIQFTVAPQGDLTEFWRALDARKAGQAEQPTQEQE